MTGSSSVSLATLALSISLATAATTASAGEPRSDACGDWSVVPTPVPPNAAQAIVRDIVAIAPDDVWAVGGWSGTVSGQLQSFGFAMHWDGESWTFADIPQPTACSVCHNITLWGVDANGPDDVWAAGHAQVQGPGGFLGIHVLIMHYDGESWEVMDAGIDQGGSGDLIWDVEAIAPDDVWFFGENLYSGPPLLLELAIALHWDGSSFELVEVPIVNFQTIGFGNGNSLHAGSALATDDIWAVGAAADGDSLTCDLSQIHHWNGREWQHVPADAPEGCFDHSLYTVEALAPDDVWAGGEYFDIDGFHGLALHWDGSSWTQVDTPIGIRDFVAFASDDIYAFGGGVAHWNGSSWTLIESFSSVDGPSFTGASALGPCNIWAAGRQFNNFDQIVPLTVHLTPDDATPGDLDGDNAVGVSDLLILLGEWGTCGDVDDFPADLDGDGVVGVTDLLQLLAGWSA